MSMLSAAGGWFHTGDQGFLDDEGFLTLTGRLKELINRGGEKISPLEVGHWPWLHAKQPDDALPHQPSTSCPCRDVAATQISLW